jgi:hypothetical protein
MPEANANLEIAKHLQEHGSHDPAGGQDAGGHGRHRLRIEIIEILEAILLAFVALTTAWSGYQAARWDGHSAEGYATASRLRVESEQASLQSGQLALYDTTAFNTWLTANAGGDTKLADLMVKRFTPNYRVAFDAWLKLDPLSNPKAPVGPRFMPQYKDPLQAQAATLSNESTGAFNDGVNSRKRAEDYVGVTVVLAAVLFLVALGQRFKLRGVRIAVTCVAGGFLVYVLALIATFPRA